MTRRLATLYTQRAAALRRAGYLREAAAWEQLAVREAARDADAVYEVQERIARLSRPAGPGDALGDRPDAPVDPADTPPSPRLTTMRALRGADTAPGVGGRLSPLGAVLVTAGRGVRGAA